MNPPILIVAFNRPSETAQLIEALTPVAPPVVYAAVDGPRSHVPKDAARCEQVRDQLEQLPWAPELHTLFRESNLGCGLGVSGAIDWFFANEPEGVILEDDILPHESMLPFMGAMLSRYRDDERVMHVSGSNYAGARAIGGYFFSRYVSIWGWATWRRAWEHFSLDISDWRRLPDVLRKPGLDWRTRRYLAFAFDRAASGLGNWDYQWKYAVMRYGLAITPNANLSVTTGFGEDATALAEAAVIPALEPMPTGLSGPAAVEANADLDRQLFREQLARGTWYEEAARLVIPSPRALHGLGAAVRGAARLMHRS